MSNFDYKKYINYFLIGYAFCIPISKAGTNIFEILAIIFWLLEGNWKEKYNLFKNNILSILIVVFIVVNFIFLPNASSYSFGLNYISKYRHFIIILIMFTSLKREYIHYIFSAFLSGMLISEIISYGIFFEIWHYKNISPNDPSPFMSHTDYSVFLSFTSIILLLNILNDNISLKMKVLYAIFFTTVTGNLFVNGGRTGQVVYLVLIFITFIMSIKSKLKASIISIILLLSVLFLAYNISPVFKNRFDYSISDISNMIQKNNYNGTFAKRVALWDVGFHKYLDKPIIGYGIGNDMKNLKPYTEKLGYSYVMINRYRKSDNHNTFITVALQLGITGFILIILILYSILKLKFKTRYFKILNTVFVVAFFMWSMGGITLHTMNPMIFFALFAGLFNKISYLELKGEKVTL